ncbi:MAG: phosphoribosyltransferase [Flavobacteriia bacterium]|nr:phosphoribosyltransferase [Flavobacteriia bacterium]
MQIILSPLQIDQKTTRIAYEIKEFAFENKSIFLGGICGNGLILAKKIGTLLHDFFNIETVVFEIYINKDLPLSEEILLSIEGKSFENETVVLLDDVINSGKTMQYALMKLLEFNPRAIKTVALVERSYRRYPIHCDFVGLSLSTTLKNHVEIKCEKEEFTAYLV